MDDAQAGVGTFMRAKHLFVLIHIKIRGEVSADKHVQAIQYLLY